MLMGKAVNHHLNMHDAQVPILLLIIIIIIIITLLLLLQANITIVMSNIIIT